MRGLEDLIQDVHHRRQDGAEGREETEGRTGEERAKRQQVASGGRSGGAAAADTPAEDVAVVVEVVAAPLAHAAVVARHADRPPQQAAHAVSAARGIDHVVRRQGVGGCRMG